METTPVPREFILKSDETERASQPNESGVTARQDIIDQMPQANPKRRKIGVTFDVRIRAFFDRFLQ